MRGLSGLLADAADALPPADAAAARARLKRVHFTTQPLPAMRNWLPTLLRRWRSPRAMLIATSGGSGVRLAARHQQKLYTLRAARTQANTLA